MLRLLPFILAALLLGSVATRIHSVRADPAGAGPQDSAILPEVQASFDPFLLNIRMSQATVQPPSGIVKQAWTLEGYRLGKLAASAPRAAVIDNDHHQRLLILSATDDGSVRLYRVGDLPLEIGTRLPRAISNAHTRGCRHQRMDPAGELGCLALSLLEALQE